MFVGYQNIKTGEHTEIITATLGDKTLSEQEVIVPDYEEHASFIAETQEELENMPCVKLDRIEEVPFAELYDGVIYTDEDSLIKAKQSYVRKIRNKYLVDYVDGAVSNPLRWADMDQELKDMYTNYRRYLLDYTETEDWWEDLPMDLDTWRKQ